MEKTGKAYAFFDCKASKGKIEKFLPVIRERIKTPSNLELSLTEGEESLNGDPEAMKALEAAKKYSLNRLPKYQREGTSVNYRYMLKAELSDSTNYAAADRLGDIMNPLYGKQLYPQREEFFGEVVYMRGNKFVHLH